MSDLVGNPEDHFSPVAIYMVAMCQVVEAKMPMLFS